MSLEDNLEHYRENGYVVLGDLVDASELEQLRSSLQPYLDLDFQGRNDFEGLSTQRVYSLVGRGKIFEQTAEHPRVMELLARLLEPRFLLTASQVIYIHPGETAQPVHTDDCFYPLARPRAAVLFAGTLLHRGGANRSSLYRRAFSHQYCQPWARQQENFMTSIPKERARKMCSRLQQMLGYSIHPPFMGQIAARHPLKTLDDDYVNSLIADDERISARSKK
ncbi:MAG: phytanoyl-CoA dioxygenase family protein [Halioglobus sp.]